MNLLKLSWQCEIIELKKNHSGVIFYLCYILSCNNLYMCSNYFALESHNFEKDVLICIVMNQFIVSIVICQLFVECASGLPTLEFFPASAAE